MPIQPEKRQNLVQNVGFFLCTISLFSRRGPEKPPWGVDMTTESDSSLTIVAVAPDGALGKSPRFFD